MQILVTWMKAIAKGRAIVDRFSIPKKVIGGYQL